MDSAKDCVSSSVVGARSCSVIGNMEIVPSDASALYLYWRNACWISVCMLTQVDQSRVEDFKLGTLKATASKV